VRLYWEMARRGYRRYAAYPAATWAGVFTNTAFGFMQAYIFIAVYEHRSDIGGLDVTQTLTYVWLVQALIAAIQVFGWPDLALRIKSGDIATDLVRPVHPLRIGVAFDLGRALYHTLFRGIPPFVLGALVFDLTVPSSPLLWLAFLVSLVLAIVVSYAFRALYNMSAFWLLDHRGTTMIAASAIAIFSGLYVPLQFMPDWLESFARATPFAALVQLPVDIFVGEARGSEILAVLAVQAGWAAVMFALAHAVFAAGRRKLVVQGG
jgi:viologen exporter family transport system permease protein